MWEMIRHAWEGWLSINLSGKYIVLVISLLVYLWIGKVGYTMKEEHKRMLLYTTVLVPLCICPLTAAVFMGYQTRFYDYPWIWSMVPITVMIAMGGTIMLIHMQEDSLLPKAWQRGIFVAVLVALLWLSGDLGKQEQQLSQEKLDYQTAEIIVEQLQAENRPLCIWGPTMVQEYVRIIDPQIQVPYGRNMWDKSLNAYFYDTYDEESILLYKTMDYAQNKARFTDVEMLDLAIDKGVTHLVLPGYLLYEDAVNIAQSLGSEIRQMQGYFVVTVQ